jgi:perosamine synthetase
MYTIFLRDGNHVQRDQIMRELDSVGIETRPVFYPMHVLPPYEQPSSFPVADLWSERGINLPTHQDLTQGDVARIASGLRDILGRL